MSEKKVQHYENDQIKVQFNPNICEHAAECVKGLPTVFDVSKKKWINVDGSAANEITTVIDKCPTGALSYALANAATAEVSSDEKGVTMTLVPNGPIRVAGKITVQDDKGAILAEMDKASLCRCGLSANKPFCDGSHKREGWQE